MGWHCNKLLSGAGLMRALRAHNVDLQGNKFGSLPHRLREREGPSHRGHGLTAFEGGLTRWHHLSAMNDATTAISVSTIFPRRTVPLKPRRYVPVLGLRYNKTATPKTDRSKFQDELKIFF